MMSAHLSKDFFDLVKAIGESKSKQQEDQIIRDEVQTLKRKMPEAKISRKKMKEFLVRLIYVEMLGHDAAFGYIRAIELAASKNLIQKRVGYLCSGLCLSPDHEFRFMLVNQLQQDMTSANFLEVAAALSGTVRLATLDMIPPLISHVVKLLSHDRELVRKKTVMVLHRFHRLDSSAVSNLGPQMRRTLCDKDPSVMAASLCLLHAQIMEKPLSYKELVPSFVSILKQIVEHRLPRDFDYHRMPAPWAQLRLLRILALLGRADQSASEGMYEVLGDVIRRADTGINVGYAIVYECVRTVTTIYPNSTLLDEAARAIARFLGSENHNLKYLGITGLAQVVEQHPKYAAEHHLAVIDCLSSVDDTLKRKTLDLLYRMMNPVNVEFIASKLLESLESSTDEFLRQALVSRLCTAAERFAPSNAWYVATVVRVMELAGDLVPNEVAQQMLSLVAEGGEDGDADVLRKDAVDRFVGMLHREVVPDGLFHVLAWVLGEFAQLSTEDVAGAIATLAADDSRLKGAPRARELLLTALLKLAAQNDDVATKAALRSLAERFASSSNIELQQRALEALNLLDAAAEDPGLLEDALPYDASLEDPLDGIVTDEGEERNGGDALGFLDRFVASALAAGAAPYQKPEDDAEEDASEDEDEPQSNFKFEAYAEPQKPGRRVQATAYPVGDETLNDEEIARRMQEAEYATQPPRSTARGGNAIGSGGGLAAASGPWGAPRQPQQPAAPPPAAARAASQQHARAPTPTEPAEKTAAQEEKERMAAALFGGVGAAAAAKPARPPRTSNASPASRSPPPAAPEPSLLDLGAPDEPPPAPPAPSVSDLLGDLSAPAPVPAPPSAAASDPFAAFDGLSLTEAPSTTAFAPEQLTTADFGGRWGPSKHEQRREVALPPTRTTPDAVAAGLATVGAALVEAIPATRELILAATHAPTSVICLWHVKLLANAAALVTVRSPNPEVARLALEASVGALSA